MSKLIKRCKECDKIWETKDSVEFMPGLLLISSKNCDHFETKNKSDGEVPDFTFADGTVPYHFQKENISLFIRSGLKAGCFDEVGLGKTLSALGLLRVYDLHPEIFNNQEVYPVAILVKSGLKLQWSKEILNRLGVFAQIVDKSSDPNFDLFKIHIYSMDLLKNLDIQHITSLPYKTIIIDECQLIKNPTSKRTNAVRDLVRGGVFAGHLDDCPSLTELNEDDDEESYSCTCPPPNDTSDKNVIVLSGTPIKNNAGEYFVICNLTHPELFPEYEDFLRVWTHSYWTGKSYQIGGLRNPAKFKEFTSDFFIRHEQKEVLPDLPKILRNFQIRVIEDKFKKKYDEELENFKDYYNDNEDDEFTRSSNILGYMNRMRHIVGIAKSKDAVEFITEFLTSTERKLVVFHHHHDVGSLISQGMVDICKELGIHEPLLISDVDPDTRERRIQKFIGSDNGRLLIASTLKSGEGLNLQVCSDCLIVERQWNPANEEQAEGRFRRIGSKASHINSTYLIGAGSIDELFSEIVERKRRLIEEANRGEELPDTWDEKSVMKELAEVLAESGLKKFDVRKKFEAQRI